MAPLQKQGEYRMKSFIVLTAVAVFTLEMPLPRSPAAGSEAHHRCRPARSSAWPTRNCRSTVTGRKTDRDLVRASSGRPNSLHDGDGGGNAGFDIEIRIVQDMRVGAAFRGDAARLRSRSSRLRISARIGASSASSPRARASSVRRRARTCGSATTKIFTSAFGQITVPMSRPSSTAPGGSAANCR